MIWQDELTSALAGCNKLVVLGVGSELCGDDAVGMLVAYRLHEILRGDKSHCLPLGGSTAPENFTGVIKEYCPDVLLLVDAAYVGGDVGSIGLIPTEQIKSASLSTHMLPFEVTLNYLQEDIGCKVIVLGVQPGRTEFATDPCEAISDAAEQIAEHILHFLP